MQEHFLSVGVDGAAPQRSLTAPSVPSSVPKVGTPRNTFLIHTEPFQDWDRIPGTTVASFWDFEQTRGRPGGRPDIGGTSA